MGIKKFIAEADTTITNAYDSSLTRRSYYANMGAADSLEIYSIFGQVTNSSVENTRILIKFPIDQINNQRASGSLPNSGSVNFFMKLSNVKHPFSLPSNYDILIAPVSSSWEEGIGLDMEDYLDEGATSTKGNGANWIYRELNKTWNFNGGDYLFNYSKTFHVNEGQEDLFVDITDIVENQLNNTIPNYGLGIMLSGGFESSTGSISYYTKKFSARNSQFFFERPCIEARWESVLKDDRGDFYCSSSLLDGDDNKYNIYFYNKIKGKYKNIPGNSELTIKFYSDEARNNEILPSYLSMSNPSLGIYRASVSLDTTSSVVYDYWVNTSNTSSVYFSSSLEIKKISGFDYNEDSEFVFKISNLKDKYSTNESARLKIFSRQKNWNPTIYNISNNSVENFIHKNLYYKIFRYSDNYNIIDYSTGSIQYSLTSYDINGNYFDLDISMLEPDYSYGIKLGIFENNSLKESKELFKFRVE